MNRLTICIVLVFFMSGCYHNPHETPPDDIWSVVIDVYSERIAPVTPECERWLERTVVLEAGERIPHTSIPFSDHCREIGGWGCHAVANDDPPTVEFLDRPPNERSYIYCAGWSGLADYRNACFVHEYLHALSHCMIGDSNNSHSDDALWCDSGAVCVHTRGTNTESVEWQVNKIVF
jgi:hypothetical protein